jgi:hypothetical protein
VHRDFSLLLLMKVLPLKEAKNPTNLLDPAKKERKEKALMSIVFFLEKNYLTAVKNRSLLIIFLSSYSSTKVDCLASPLVLP